MKISLQKTETSISATKTFNAPLNSDRIIVEYDFKIEGDNYVVAYEGPFIMVDDAGTKTCHRTENANSTRAYVNGAGRTLSGVKWTAGTQYRIKYDINMVNKTYKYYIDEGSGYVQKFDTTGNGNFTYKGENLKEIKFSFVSSTSYQANYIIDNVKVYAPDWEYIYVCPTTGNDTNDGSYEKPLKTVEAAYALAESKIGMENKEVFVKLKSGNYNFDSSYTFGELDKNAYYNEVAFIPDNYADITISGDYNVNMPGLDIFEDEGLKAEFIEDIKDRYVETYDSYPLSIGQVRSVEDSNGNLVTSVRLANSGKTTARAALVSIVYDDDGALMGIDIANAAVVPGTETTLSSTIAIGDAAAFRSFLWEDMSTLIPLIKSEFTSEFTLNNVFTDRITELEMLNQGDVVSVNGTTVPNSMVTVCMRTATNKIVYAEQTVSGADGSFEFDVNPMFMPIAGTINVSSTNGGAI